MNCTLCKDGLDPDADPDVVYDYSPVTFRKGWMHGYCARIAFEDLDQERKDAYLALGEDV